MKDILFFLKFKALTSVSEKAHLIKALTGQSVTPRKLCCQVWPKDVDLVVLKR